MWFRFETGDDRVGRILRFLEEVHDRNRIEIHVKSPDLDVSMCIPVPKVDGKPRAKLVITLDQVRISPICCCSMFGIVVDHWCKRIAGRIAPTLIL